MLLWKSNETRTLQCCYWGNHKEGVDRAFEWDSVLDMAYSD